MTQANVHLFAMLDQLIEGHQWVKTNLNVIPKSGWSIDPFGHGSTVPYLLASSGFEGTIIQRIHYNWKQVSGNLLHLTFSLIILSHVVVRQKSSERLYVETSMEFCQEQASLYSHT